MIRNVTFGIEFYILFSCADKLLRWKFYHSWKRKHIKTNPFFGNIYFCSAWEFYCYLSLRFKFMDLPWVSRSDGDWFPQEWFVFSPYSPNATCLSRTENFRISKQTLSRQNSHDAAGQQKAIVSLLMSKMSNRLHTVMYFLGVLHMKRKEKTNVKRRPNSPLVLNKLHFE